MDERICSKCGVSKPETSEFFGKRGNAARGGLRPDCKACVSESNRRYREANGERIRGQKAAHRAANPEASRSREAAYMSTPEGRATRYRNSAKWNRSSEGRLFYAITQLRRRAEASGLLANFTADDWHRCLELFEDACAYCGATETLTQEHVIPDSKGGPYTATNVVVACRPCNTSKHDSDMETWFRSQTFFTPVRLARIVAHVNGA
ncbi:HNH endonuclease [Nocardioides sp. InS609-2]|uniref:HNH endonuclease n=1 Tax=Nocardioides sp. InS609-2 TaxID=2760705 RepID=UPI0020BE0383|nr:HNH endonuclease [Nocardioides sp. InS609-2]